MDTRRDPFKNFFRHAIDLSILTPWMLKELTQSVSTWPAQNNCELLVTAGFLPTELAKETIRRVTTKLGIVYGSTELATSALLSQSCTEGDLYWLAPAPNRTVRIVDESGNECPSGKQGELRIGLMDIDCKSYLDDEETSAKVFRDGFFCPGASQRRPALPLAMIAASGCLISWAIEAVIAPIVVSRETRESSNCSDISRFRAVASSASMPLKV